MDRYEQTLSALEEMIAKGGVADDGRLPTERELSEKLGVGRRVLRRALSALESNGTVYRRQGSGTYLSVMGNEADALKLEAGSGSNFLAIAEIANPVELIELRIAIEPVMCRLAALRSSGQDVERLRKLAEATQKAGNFQDYRLADSAFHTAIARLSRNALFEILQDALGTALRDQALARFGESGNCFKRQAEHVNFHFAIVEAIADRQADKAESLMHQHLSDVHKSLFEQSIPSGLFGRREVAAE
ncbi:MAG: FadR/GntR family transcriptional regulator [Pseudomonadota bacterium]